MAKKPSLFQRLTGTVTLNEEYETVSDDNQSDERQDILDEANEEGQLTVDVLQTPEAVIIRTIVAGVHPDDLDVSIGRDVVTIRGTRQNDDEVNDDDYYHRELYWGTFSRTIMLPCEVEVEEASAVEKHGLLTITLPKIDKTKKAKIKVSSGK